MKQLVKLEKAINICKNPTNPFEIEISITPKTVEESENLLLSKSEFKENETENSLKNYD